MGLTAAIEAHDVSYHTAGRPLLAGVTLTIQPGEIVALCGPNGAGKTTLLKLLARDLQPTTGRIALAGKPLPAYSPRELAQTRAVLPQETTLQFAFTVRDIVAMGRTPHKPEERDGSSVARALAETDTQSLADRTWQTLSGGERARVTLARVLAQDTPILLLDEPTAALDLRHQHHALATTRKLARQQRTIVAVLHDLNLAARVADRIALLKHGSLYLCAPPWQALTTPHLQAVFETPIHVTTNPIAQRPLVIPALDDPLAEIPPERLLNSPTEPPNTTSQRSQA